MKHFRKSRKHGGVEVITSLYVCRLLKSRKLPGDKTCAKEFTEANNFKIIITDDDGNCFYDTLSKFGKKANLERLNKPHLVLREELVDKLLENPSKVANYIIYNNEFELLNKIEKLKNNGEWINDTSDIVSQYASTVFNIILNIFDVKDGAINKIIMRPLSTNNSTVEVNMLRINDNHYQLLWPASEEDNSNESPTRPVTKKKSSRVTKKKLPEKSPEKPSTRRLTAKKLPEKSPENNSYNENIRKAIRLSLLNLQPDKPKKLPEKPPTRRVTKKKSPEK
jgi:hypothetical protein